MIGRDVRDLRRLTKDQREHRAILIESRDLRVALRGDADPARGDRTAGEELAPRGFDLGKRATLALERAAGQVEDGGGEPAVAREGAPRP